MNGHPQFDEDLDLYALGVLEGAELEALEVHLRRCVECGRKLSEAHGRMALLALAAPATTPPAEARSRLMRRVGTQELGRAAESGFRAWVIWRWGTPLFAAASLILTVTAALLVVQNRKISRRVAELQAARRDLEATRERDAVEAAHARAVLDVLTAPDTLRVTLVAEAARPVPQGKAFYNSRRGLLFYAANLPPLPPQQTYQLWLVPAEGKPISAGVFKTDATGNGEVVLPPIPAGVLAKAFAVTVEPAGGVPQPTGPKVLIGVVS